MARGKPTLVEFKRHEIGDEVTSAVRNVLKENWPFVMLAQRPDGHWETSMFLPPTVTSYEAAGALFQAQHHLFYPECDDLDEEE